MLSYEQLQPEARSGLQLRLQSANTLIKREQSKLKRGNLPPFGGHGEDKVWYIHHLHSFGNQWNFFLTNTMKPCQVPLFALLVLALACGCTTANTGGGWHTGTFSVSTSGSGWHEFKDQMKPLKSELAKTWSLCSELMMNESARAFQCTNEQLQTGWGMMTNATSSMMARAKNGLGKLSEVLSSSHGANGMGKDYSVELNKIAEASQSAKSHLEQVEKEVSMLREEIARLKTTHIFAVAIHNANHNSFQYYDAEEFQDSDGVNRSFHSAKLPKDSAALVRKILFAFQQGHSVIVRLASCERIDNNKPWEEVKDSCTDFYHQIKDQLHKLTGVRPNLEWLDDGRCKFTFPN